MQSSSKVSTAMDELQYLMNFNSSITQAAAKTMEYFTEFVFIYMGNLTLVRRDACLTHLKSDNIIRNTEEEIAQFESKGHTSASRGKGRYHPMKELTKGQTENHPTSRIDQHGRTLARDTIGNSKSNLPAIPYGQPRASSHMTITI